MKSGKDIQGISEEAMQKLVYYHWPGNVRELKSAFEYGFVTCQELLIQPHHFPPAVTSAQPIAKTIKKNLLNRADMKKKQLIEALERAGGNQSRAADILGVSRVTVWNRMKKYDITAQKKINP